MKYILINLDTIFLGSSINKFYLDGGFAHKYRKETVVRYRYFKDK